MNLNPLKRRGILLKIIFTVVVPVHTKIGKTCRATCQNLVIKGTSHKLRYQKRQRNYSLKVNMTLPEYPLISNPYSVQFPIPRI